MKSHFIFLIIAIGLAGCVRSGASRDLGMHHPRYELEMNGAQYANFLAGHPALLEDSDAVLLKPILELGKRNLDWLKQINSARDVAHRISLSSKETEEGFPIDQPREYNAQLSLQRFADLQRTIPSSMLSVLTGSQALPNQPVLTDAEHIVWGYKTDRLYQLTVRWLMAKQYLDEYKIARRNDVRGFYFLSQVRDLEAQLDHWQQLSPAVQKRYQEWLIGSCGNSRELSDCARDFDNVVLVNGVKNYWQAYRTASQKLYDDFFRMQWDRTDIVWSRKSPQVLTIPFVDPQNAVVASYLKDNVEDEWKWNGWNLRINFRNGDKSSMSHLEFQPGVTAHVQVPNTIVMDENQPTTEYDSQWTIRHEFGHILGFPDCYVEFYDEARAVMVSYQLDTTNLMCSRQGAFKQTHFDELKRVYFR